MPKKRPPTLSLAPGLEALVLACEKVCVAECCGIDAFDFSPLHIASHLSAHSGTIAESAVAEVLSDIQKLLSAAASLEANDDGFICSIDCMNQNFTRESLSSFVEALEIGLRFAPRVLEYSEGLRDSDS